MSTIALIERLREPYEQRQSRRVAEELQAATELTTLLQRCEKAEAERDAAYKNMVPIHDDGNWVFIDGPGDVELDHGGKLRTRAELAERQRDEARKALEPFARIEPVSISLLGGEHISSDAFRAARNAIGELK